MCGCSRPGSEVPFAGHPNIGAAFALANDRPLHGDDLIFEEKAGLVRLRLERIGERAVGASLTAPLTVTTREAPGVAAVAAALSLQDNEIVTGTHPPINASVGLEFMFVEVRDVAALGKARVNLPAFDVIRDSHGIEGVHLYVKWPTDDGVRIQARNLSPYDGIGEDAATGSATASLPRCWRNSTTAPIAISTWRPAKASKWAAPACSTATPRCAAARSRRRASAGDA